MNNRQMNFTRAHKTPHEHGHHMTNVCGLQEKEKNDVKTKKPNIYSSRAIRPYAQGAQVPKVRDKDNIICVKPMLYST